MKDSCRVSDSWKLTASSVIADAICRITNLQRALKDTPKPNKSLRDKELQLFNFLWESPENGGDKESFASI